MGGREGEHKDGRDVGKSMYLFIYLQILDPVSPIINKCENIGLRNQPSAAPFGEGKGRQEKKQERCGVWKSCCTP